MRSPAEVRAQLKKMEEELPKIEAMQKHGVLFLHLTIIDSLRKELALMKQTT